MLNIILLLAMLQGSPAELPSDIYTATAYAETGYNTATGIYPTVGKTIAVDPHVIPLNSWVWVEDFGLRKAMDTGGFIKGKRIDIYLGDEATCIEFGRRDKKVWVITKEDV